MNRRLAPILSRRLILLAVSSLILAATTSMGADVSVKVTATQGSITGTRFCTCAGDITFTAALQNCPKENPSVTYTWTGDVTGTGATVTKAFTQAGTGKKATVTVTGDYSCTDTLTFEVVGDNAVPTSVDIKYEDTEIKHIPRGKGGLTQGKKFLPNQAKTNPDITAYCDKLSVWKCVVSKAEETFQIQWGMSGLTEVTGDLVTGTDDCAVLKKMGTDLGTVADRINIPADVKYWMKDATIAHEQVHVKHDKAAHAAHFPTFKTAVEALTVPFADHTDAAAAKTAIKAKQEYIDAYQTYRDNFIRDHNKSARHDPKADFTTAQHGVVDPMIKTIGDRKTALNCP